MENKICVIGVYFGKLPKYFPLWLKSCEKNPNIDFLLFTDQEFAQLPENVKCYPMTISQMQHRASQELGFEAQLERPYKCCDYKVIYGLIFKDYISQYDYWGCCDFDLIFGDLQSFFDRYALYQYDRFLPLGHLCLYRNTEEVNGRYRCEGSAHDYKEVYSTETICGFDEYSGMVSVYQKNGFPMFTKRIFVDVATVYHRYRIIEEYPLDEKAINYKEQIFYWDNGKTYRAYFDHGELHTEEYIYVHFQKRPNFELSFAAQEVDAFYITNTGFYPKTGEVTREIIKELNPYPGKLKEIYERTRFQLRTLRKKIERKIGQLS